MPDSAATTDELVFLPLGGCGEIGMNLNAYGYGPAHSRRWIIVDVGVTFGNAATPGIDLICADPAYLVGEHIDAVFLTHAHEDHIGAIGLLYPLLRTRAPIYATPFTAELVRGKMQERGGRYETAQNHFAGSFGHGRTIYRPLHDPHPFDPRTQRAGDRDAGGDDPAYRRLEDRS